MIKHVAFSGAKNHTRKHAMYPPGWLKIRRVFALEKLKRSEKTNSLMIRNSLWRISQLYEWKHLNGYIP